MDNSRLCAFSLFCLVPGIVAHFDYKPFLEPHVKTPLYGRYAGMSPATDPRIDKTGKLAEVFGGVAAGYPNPADYETAKAYGKGFAEAMDGFFGSLLDANAPRYKPPMKSIEIDGVDGNKIPLDIYQGTSKTCYYYTHGGGMAFMSSRTGLNPYSLSTAAGKHGTTIISVEFRNFLHHPDPNIKPTQFPAGLNDCYSGLEWVYDHKEELGCETIVNYGESGGGNLCLALSLKTLKEGRPELIDGSFCHCPDVQNDVFSQRTPSVTENAGYMFDMYSEGFQKMMIDFYTANPEDKKNPLAWPIEAGPEDMKGMKPVMIIVNEADPLRDIGLEMYRNLLAGGVRAEARMVAGTFHAGDLASVGGADSYLYDTTVNAMKSFAAGLRGKILVEADPPPAEVEVKAE